MSVGCTATSVTIRIHLEWFQKSWKWKEKRRFHREEIFFEHEWVSEREKKITRKERLIKNFLIWNESWFIFFSICLHHYFCSCFQWQRFSLPLPFVSFLHVKEVEDEWIEKDFNGWKRFDEDRKNLKSSITRTGVDMERFLIIDFLSFYPFFSFSRPLLTPLKCCEMNRKNQSWKSWILIKM